MYVFWEIGHLKNNEGIEWPTKSSRSFEVSQSGTKSIWKKVPSREAALFASAFLKYFQGGPERCYYHFMSFFGGWTIQFSNLGKRSNTYLSFISLFLLIFSLLSMRPTYYVPSFKKDQGMWVIVYWLKIDLEVKLLKNPNKN